MKQVELYEPIRRWLTADGFAATVTGANLSVVIPIATLVSMPYKVPDVVGIRDGRVAIVEVEQNKTRFFDALGRCLLWKCTASYVYLAFPVGAIDRAPILQRLGIGLLTVDPDTGLVTAPIQLPRDGVDFRAISTKILHLPARVVVTYSDTGRDPVGAQSAPFSLGQLKGVSELPDDRRHAEQEPPAATL